MFFSKLSNLALAIASLSAMAAATTYDTVRTGHYSLCRRQTILNTKLTLPSRPWYTAASTSTARPRKLS